MSEPRRWTLWARGNDEVARARESDPKIAIGAGLVEVEVVESSALAASEARCAELLRERDEARRELAGRIASILHNPDIDGDSLAARLRREGVKMGMLHRNEEVAALAAQVETLREALKELAVLGNGDRPGNSIGNRIAQRALVATAPKGDANEQAR